MNPPMLLLPNSPKDFGLESGLFVPVHMTEKYRNECFRDAGLGGIALSYRHMVGISALPEDAIQIISKYDPFLLFAFLSRLSVYISHRGPLSCEEDNVQRDFYNAAIRGVERDGTKVSSDFKETNMNLVFSVGPDVLNALTALVIANGFVAGGKDVNRDYESLAVAVSIVNDTLFEPNPDGVEVGRDLHLNLLRQFMLQAPFQGALDTFAKRIHRFRTLYRKAFEIAGPSLRSEVDECLHRDLGISFEELNSLVFPLCAFWLSKKNHKVNTTICLDQITQDSLREGLGKILSKISLTHSEYTQEVRALRSKAAQNYLTAAPLLRTFTRNPFIRFPDSNFILLAPYLLLRKIELSVDNAFKDSRSANRRVEGLLSPLGKAFESYTDSLFNRKLDDGMGSLTPIYEPNPGKAGDELCDAIVHDADACIVLQKKYHQPPISSITDQDKTSSSFFEWIEYSFLREATKIDKQKLRRGSLWQLRNSIERIRNGELGYNPRTIVPVILVPWDYISPVPLYEILDVEIERRGIFKNLSGASPFLIISVGELEYLTSMELTSKWTVAKIFFEKSTAPGARYMNWSKYLGALKLKYSLPADQERTLDELIKQTGDFIVKANAIS